MVELDMTFTGKFSEDCKSIVIDYADSIVRLLYPHKDTQLEIQIKKFYKNRTSAQNRYCHGVMIPTVQAWQKETTGEHSSHDGLYAFFRTHIIGDEVIMEEIDGVDTMVLTGKRFSQCNTVEFAERVDKIIYYYAEKGCVILPPDPKSNNLITDFMKDFSKDIVYCRQCGKAHAGYCSTLKDE